MKTFAANKQTRIFRNTIASLTMAAAFISTGEAHAYDLQANTIYAQANGVIYAVDVDAATATKVADANASLSPLQDLAFDGSTMYGANLHWELMKLEPQDSAATDIKGAESYSLEFRGLESRDGILYGAETHSLVIIDQATGNPEELCPGCGSYGLGAGEQVDDLAFAEDGTLYAAVTFSGIPYTYLGTIDITTGYLNLIGNTGVEYVTAITVKDGTIYGMDSTGNLYTVNKVSGFATIVADAVLSGVTGMGTSPMTVDTGSTDTNAGSTGTDTGTGDSSSAGSMTWLVLMLAGVLPLLRRFR
jgi:hypothetical protein